jgi:hypothetical protein
VEDLGGDIEIGVIVNSSSVLPRKGPQVADTAHPQGTGEGIITPMVVATTRSLVFFEMLTFWCMSSYEQQRSTISSV